MGERICLQVKEKEKERGRERERKGERQTDIEYVCTSVWMIVWTYVRVCKCMCEWVFSLNVFSVGLLGCDSICVCSMSVSIFCERLYLCCLSL